MRKSVTTFATLPPVEGGGGGGVDWYNLRCRESRYLKWLYLLQSTVRDLFSVNANDADFEEMVSADKDKEEQPAKKNAKSQNAFEEVSKLTYPNLYLCKPNGNAEPVPFVSSN